MNDAKYPYEHYDNILGENMLQDNAETESNGRLEQITLQNFIEILKGFNEILMKDQEQQNQINDYILQSLIDMQ